MRTAVRAYGLQGLPTVINRRLFGSRLECYGALQHLLAGKSGLEVGGPSRIFSRRNILPVYPIVRSLDNCNFRGATVWEGTIREGRTFQFDPQKPAGMQYLMEATDLHAIPDHRYEFVLSSHTLEHSANPLRALSEFSRVLTPDGILVLVLPHKERTFDHRRQVTPLEHMIGDYDNNMPESDLTHLPEILSLHDLSLDVGAGDPETFESRCRRNFENRCLHHHVFITKSAVELMKWLAMDLLAVEPARPYHILVAARKSGPGVTDAPGPFPQPGTAYFGKSPFFLDRT